MNKSGNQLETVLQEVSDYFANTPRITVIPKEGSPPDQYQITYQITGICKESDGDIYSCDNHVISISLPFGFPHFPPNCLPESPTFHPDFDSSAICIGDVWEADKSIVTLILHIGRMISGEIFSENNAFNSEAAEWYNANTEQLPFDNTDFTEQDSTLPSIEEEPELQSIDTLDDDDFGNAFSLEQNIPAPATLDTDRLRIIAKQKRFQALSRELNTIKEQFEGRQELEEQTQSSMDKAMALFQEADTLEHQGEQQQALDKYNAVEEIVSDYPMLQEAKERAQQAFDLLGDWVNSNASDDPDSTIAETVADSSLSDDTTPIQSGKRTFFEDKKAVSKKWFLFALGSGSIAFIAMLIFSYFSLGSSLKKAGKSYEECQALLDVNNFKETEVKCEKALSLTAEVRMVRQNEKEELVRKIQNILSSQKLQQGLTGKTLFDGQYVSKSIKKLLLAFKEARKNGDAFFEKELWNEAASSYTKALNMAKNTDAVDESLLAEIRQRLPRSQFNTLMRAGVTSLAISDWVSATGHFNKALKLAKANPQVLLEDIPQLEILSNQAKFNALRELGHKSFSAEEWSTALSSYESALDLVANLDMPESETISNLHENIAKTKIYMTIEKGKKAFAASHWDEVIAQYGKAILLLEENSKLLSRINTKENHIKLSRIMLHVVIIQHKQDVAKYLKSEEYAAAVEELKNIQQSVTSSQFADQDEFKTILKEIVPQLQDTEEQLTLIKHSTYLKNNFKKLFLKHYTTATYSTLSNPRVEYLRNIGDKPLFRIQCTSTDGGRPLRLQMDYLYSPGNGRWSFYSQD